MTGTDTTVVKKSDDLVFFEMIKAFTDRGWTHYGISSGFIRGDEGYYMNCTLFDFASEAGLR